MLSCMFSREVWVKVLAWSGWQHLALGMDDGLPNWRLRRRKVVARTRRKVFDSLVFLMMRSLWLERNARVFRNGSLLPNRVVDDIRESCDQWCQAGLIARSILMGE
jgi:hypothetical protein